MRKLWFSWFFGYLFLKFQKKRRQKLLLLEEKQGQIWNQHWIPHKVMKPYFKFSSYFSDDRRFSNRYILFQKIPIFWPLTCNKKNFVLQNCKYLFITLCRIQCRFQNCPCFSSSIDNFWLLFFWRFKNTFYVRGIYIYIYICICRVLLWCFEAINTSNQGTICSCMIFYPSCFILYIIFSMNLIIFYTDVTTLLWRHSFFDRF